MSKNKPLPFGMTIEPLGWQNPILVIAFIDFVRYALSSKDIKTHYKAESGVDLFEFQNQTQLEQMIDEATGYTEATLGKFMDWIAVNHWGIKETEEKP